MLHLDSHLLCHRTPQGQDRSQSGNWGSSGWGHFHLDTNYPQLDLVQHVYCWPGMWAGNNDGLQIQSKFINGHGEICSNVLWSFHVIVLPTFFPFWSFLCDLQAPVTMNDGKISIQFPQYHFTAEIIEDKLIMVATQTPLYFKKNNNRNKTGSLLQLCFYTMSCRIA